MFIRARAKQVRPPCLRDASYLYLIFSTITSKLNNKLTINYILLKLIIEDPLWSLPLREGEHGDWKTPPRKTVRVLARQGKSNCEIF